MTIPFKERGRYAHSLAAWISFVGFLGISVPVLAYGTPQTCVISEVHRETINENSVMLVKVLGMINTPGSPLDDSQIAGIYFSMLLSTRHHHERMRSDLPDCAQELNTAMIDVLVASQDVVGLKLAEDANPDQARYGQRIGRAKTHFIEVWNHLAEASDGVMLTQ